MAHRKLKLHINKKISVKILSIQILSLDDQQSFHPLSFVRILYAFFIKSSLLRPILDLTNRNLESHQLDWRPFHDENFICDAVLHRTACVVEGGNWWPKENKVELFRLLCAVSPQVSYHGIDSFRPHDFNMSDGWRRKF